jgi:hypothetical protein
MNFQDKSNWTNSQLWVQQFKYQLSPSLFWSKQMFLLWLLFSKN